MSHLPSRFRSSTRMSTLPSELLSRSTILGFDLSSGKNKGFNVFFWDGKVDFSQGEASQFGDAVPSDDPLVTAVHQPNMLATDFAA